MDWRTLALISDKIRLKEIGKAFDSLNEFLTGIEGIPSKKYSKHMERARRYLQMSNYLKANVELKQVLSHAKLPDYEAYSLRALCLFALEKNENALFYVNEAIKTWSKIPAIHFFSSIGEHFNSLCIESLNQDHHDQAFHWNDVAIISNPLEPEYWYNRGLILKEKGKWVDALNSLEKCLLLGQILGKKAKYENQLWYNKGLIFMASGKPHKALKCFEAALAIDPSYEQALEKKKIVEKLPTN